MQNQNNQKGPDPLSDEPSRIFGKQLTEEETRDFINKAYKQLKNSFDRLKRPNGQKNSPGKTCRDIAAAYPESQSGKYNKLIYVKKLINSYFKVNTG